MPFLHDPAIWSEQLLIDAEMRFKMVSLMSRAGLVIIVQLTYRNKI